MHYAEQWYRAGKVPGTFASGVHFRMCDYLTRNGVVYNASIWRPHRKCGLGYVEMAPLEYYVRLMKGVEDITRANGKFAGKNTGKLRREK